MTSPQTYARGRILEPPPDRGCVQRTSRSKCGCPTSPKYPETRGLVVPLRLVLRTQPRSVSARFWRWHENAPYTRKTPGFTLIELIISAALMTMILVSAYYCLSTAFSSQKIIEPRTDIIQNARVALAIISADLRGACPLSTNYPFLGMHRMVGDSDADNLDFATHNYTPHRPHEGDFCEVSLYVDKDPLSGNFTLWRRRNPTLAFDPLSGGSREEIARGLLGLKFEYYDGFDWYDTWGDVEGTGKQLTSSRDQPNLFGLPDAVRITLSFDRNARSRAPPSSATAPSPEPLASPATPIPSEKETAGPPLIFQTVARLNLAHSAERGVSDGSSTRTIGETTGQPAPANQGGY